MGKSLLARSASGLLPPLACDELVTALKIHGAAPNGERKISARPFRAPHPSISASGLLGGGSGIIIPGEVSLAHGGILFLDELPEFRRDVIEGLREPLQSGQVSLHRIGASSVLPARFILMAAMNPCPCGNSMGGARRCICTWERVKAYRKRISGPILDRIDLGVVMGHSEGNPGGEREDEFKQAITQARALQYARWGEPFLNGEVFPETHREKFKLGADVEVWLKNLLEKREVSFRGLHKLIRVSRTIADLAHVDEVAMAHVQEAWTLRCPNLQDLKM